MGAELAAAMGATEAAGLLVMGLLATLGTAGAEVGITPSRGGGEISGVGGVGITTLSRGLWNKWS